MALADACDGLLAKRLIAASPLHGQVAAVSVGICAGVPVLDLDYAEDSGAETDMNVVMNNGGGFIEVQGTAEGHAFRRHELDALLNLASEGIAKLFQLQTEVRRPPDAAAQPVMQGQRVVLASGNPGKLRQFSELLGASGLALVRQSDFGIEPPPETGSTFLENSLIKARNAARLTGLPAIADDSGLEVDALGGRAWRVLGAICRR